MLHLNADHPRIIVPLFAHTLDQLEAQAKAAQESPQADLVELRLDPLRLDDWLGALAGVRTLVQKPLIVTIRTAREGERSPWTTAPTGTPGWPCYSRGAWMPWTSSGAPTHPSCARCGMPPSGRAPRRCSASIILTVPRTATPWWRPCTGCWTPGRT